jgi:transposase
LLEARESESLKFQSIDDAARKKGHNYNSVIYNKETGNVAAIFIGRSKIDIIDYLKGWPGM